MSSRSPGARRSRGPFRSRALRRGERDRVARPPRRDGRRRRRQRAHPRRARPRPPARGRERDDEARGPRQPGERRERGVVGPQAHRRRSTTRRPPRSARPRARREARRRSATRTRSRPVAPRSRSQARSAASSAPRPLRILAVAAAGVAVARAPPRALAGRAMPRLDVRAIHPSRSAQCSRRREWSPFRIFDLAKTAQTERAENEAIAALRFVGGRGTSKRRVEVSAPSRDATAAFASVSARAPAPARAARPPFPAASSWFSPRRPRRRRLRSRRPAVATASRLRAEDAPAHRARRRPPSRRRVRQPDAAAARPPPPRRRA